MGQSIVAIKKKYKFTHPFQLYLFLFYLTTTSWEPDVVATQHVVFNTTNHITMYYCSRSKNIEYSLEKIHIRMDEIREIIPKMAELPPTGNEDIINGLNLDHPLTELIVEYNALMIWAENPPDPRGEKMYCRVPPYFIHVSTKELALALGYNYKTVERPKKVAHKKLELKDRADVTVDEFCRVFTYPQEDIDNIHQNLAYIREGKWNKIKEIHRRQGLISKDNKTNKSD